jgi:hypothetical protein
MFRKLMLTGLIGLGTLAGVAATPNTADAGCRPTPCRVVYRHNYRHWGYRCVAPRAIYRPVVVNPCP